MGRTNSFLLIVVCLGFLLLRVLCIVLLVRCRICLCFQLSFLGVLLRCRLLRFFVRRFLILVLFFRLLLRFQGLGLVEEFGCWLKPNPPSDWETAKPGMPLTSSAMVTASNRIS